MKTKAAVFYEVNQPLSIEELELDQPKADEVLVKLAYAGLCRSDWHIMAGELPVGMAPMVLGHEGAGVVEAVGSNVTRVKPGDHVALVFVPSCGKCHWCISGMSELCDVGAVALKGPQLDGTYRLHSRNNHEVGQMCLVGSFTQYTVVHQNAVCIIEKDYGLDVASLVSCGVATGFGAAVNRAQVKPGSSVLVIGVGGIGMNAVQGAKASGAGMIIAADIHDGKLGWAKEFGATHTINAKKEDVVAKALELTNGIGVDYAFEAIATPATVGQAFAATSKAGTVVVIGLASATDTTVPMSLLDLVLLKKTVMGTLYGSGNPQIEIPRLLKMHKHGQLMLNELITRTYSLDQINEGYADLQAGKNIRGVIKF